MDILRKMCLSLSPPGTNLRQRFKCKRCIWEIKESASGGVGKREKKEKSANKSHVIKPHRITGAQSCGETLENDIEHKPQSYLTGGAMELWSPYTKSPSFIG